MMDTKKTGIVWLAIVMAATAAPAALFTQDFSSSTNAGDYIEATTPTANQFTLVNGGAISIDAGRLKIVNAAGAGGNVRRWVAMEGTPVGGMSFSFEMEIDVAAGYAANTRLYTGTIGEPLSGNHFMAWGIDATGVANEWNLTGVPAEKFTGAQTLTIVLNDSDSAFNYTDPAAGTQVLATNSYDIWIGTTLVADGKTGNFTHPEKDLTAFNLGIQSAPAVTCYFDNFEVLEIAPSPNLIIYQDDFSGAVTTIATETVPEISAAGFNDFQNVTGLDGNGHLETTAVNANANYRFQIDTAPLTDNATVTEIKYTAVLRTPTNDWVMISLQGTNSVGTLNTDANVGPMVQFSPGGVMKIRGGTWGGGSVSTFSGAYTNSEVVTAEMIYHVTNQTVDVVINGTTLATGVALEHEFPLGILSDPVVWWAQLHLRNQSAAADGGAYIDSFQIETTAPLVTGYAGWAAGWGVDIGAETNDYDGDGLINLHEYGLGGNPTNALDRGTSPESAIMEMDGTNWFGYVHPQLSDPNSGLSYSLELNTDIVLGTWTNVGYTVLGTNVTGGALDFVTNVTDTVDGQKFIRLIIE